jgi:hypothetical protein
MHPICVKSYNGDKVLAIGASPIAKDAKTRDFELDFGLEC